MRIGIKVGSALISEYGTAYRPIDDRFIDELMRQAWELIDQGHEVFIISSGAVASGYNDNQKRSKALQAAIGQPKLMAVYQNSYWLKRWNNHFGVCRADVAQILLIADELDINREHIQNLIEECFTHKVLPIINANDAVNGDELDRLERFEDNDHLFLEVCRMLKPDMAIIVTDVDGVLDEKKQLIHAFNIQDREAAANLYFKNVLNDGLGTGGMYSKVCVARCLVEEQIRVIIVNGRSNDFIGLAIRQLNDDPTLPFRFGTVFVI